MRELRRPIFPRFSEWDDRAINRDLQVHTRWTDGRASVEEMLARAREIGLAEIAFTEHARARSDYWPEFFAEVDRLPAVTGLTVYRGLEVKVLDVDGRLDLPPKARSTADLILGSVHSFPAPDGRRVPASALERRRAEELELGLARAIILGGEANVLAHAGGMCLRAHGSFPSESFEKLMALAAERDVAFEINISYHGPLLGMLIPMLRRFDPPTSIGSDAHGPEELGACRDALRRILRP